MFSTVLKFRFFLSAAVVLSSIGLQAIANESADERLQLTVLLRQLSALERMTDYGDSIARESTDRFHFDYSRLRQDLHRVRTGIDTYLTPNRAQPRDPSSLHGEYRNEGTLTP